MGTAEKKIEKKRMALIFEDIRGNVCRHRMESLLKAVDEEDAGEIGASLYFINKEFVLLKNYLEGKCIKEQISVSEIADELSCIQLYAEREFEEKLRKAEDDMDMDIALENYEDLKGKCRDMEEKIEQIRVELEGKSLVFEAVDNSLESYKESLLIRKKKGGGNENC